MALYEEIKDWVLCRLYYFEKPQLGIIKVYVPFDKSVRYVKSKDELHEICEELFEKKYFEGKHVDLYTEKVTKSIYARSVVYWLSRVGMAELDEEVKKETIYDYLFPLLENCKCSNRVKEVYLLKLDEYLSCKISLRELLVWFTMREIEVKKGFHLHKVKLG